MSQIFSNTNKLLTNKRMGLSIVTYSYIFLVEVNCQLRQCDE